MQFHLCDELWRWLYYDFIMAFDCIVLMQMNIYLKPEFKPCELVRCEIEVNAIYWT